jgi:hypothetical protein
MGGMPSSLLVLYQSWQWTVTWCLLHESGMPQHIWRAVSEWVSPLTHYRFKFYIMYILVFSIIKNACYTCNRLSTCRWMKNCKPHINLKHINLSDLRVDGIMLLHLTGWGTISFSRILLHIIISSVTSITEITGSHYAYLRFMRLA